MQTKDSAKPQAKQAKSLAHDLTQGSILQHMRSLAAPAIMGSLFMTFYNVVDTIWAGRVGIDFSQINSFRDFWQSSGDVRALTGMTMSFPIFLVILSLGVGAMSGTLALIGNALGRKDHKLVHCYLIQGLLYIAGISILLLLTVPLLPYIFRLMSANDPVVIQYAYDYMSVLIYGSTFFCISFVFSSALIARGDTKTQRNINILNFFVNIVLDPLFLFGFGPIPAMGLQGIALATVVAQLIGTTIMFIKLQRYQVFAETKLSDFRPNWGVLGTIVKQCMPPSLNMAFISFLLGLVNRHANIHGGSAAVAAYGISLRIEQIALIPSIGVRTALASIASQNNGAGKMDRIQHAYRVALLAGLVFLLFVMAPLGWIFREPILMIFTSDAQTIAIAKDYLAICVLTFYAYMLVNFSGAIFQALQKPELLTYITIGRNVVLPLITFSLFPVVFHLGLKGVWWAIFFNNWVAAIVAVLLYLKMRKSRQKELLLELPA